jgi:putative FmdB family regulatory protein
MPIFAYRCDSCGFEKDVLQKRSDPPLDTCPACSSETFRKRLTAPAFQLKGSGWYVTDFRDGGKAKSKPGESGETAAEAAAEAAGGAASQAAGNPAGNAAGNTAGTGSSAPADAKTPAAAAKGATKSAEPASSARAAAPSTASAPSGSQG